MNEEEHYEFFPFKKKSAPFNYIDDLEPGEVGEEQLYSSPVNMETYLPGDEEFNFDPNNPGENNMIDDDDDGDDNEVCLKN